jgi:hypothetical protein
MGLKDILDILRNKINKKYSCLDPTGLASSAEVPKPWGAPPEVAVGPLVGDLFV